MASKRPCVTEGNTPGKTASKRAPVEGSSRKSLFAESNKSLGQREWSSEEISALVQHMSLLGRSVDRQMAYHEERSLLECLCQFSQQYMQFLKNRFVHKISIDKLFL